MKIRISMKTPDAIYHAQADCINDTERQMIEDAAAKFFEYGEAVTLELDTEAGTCVVIER